MSTTWTQGANVRDVRAPSLMTVRDANDKVVAFVADTDHMHLISAAPDLLEALQGVFNACLLANEDEAIPFELDGDLLDAARAAIAKAQGGAT